MKNKIIIGLIGEKAGGKGSVAKEIMEKYGAKRYGVSDILKKILDNLHIPATRDNFTALAISLKNGFWQTVIIDALISDMENDNSQIVIADGIRMDGDVDPFRKKFGDNFYLFYVTADVKIRYERSKLRGEKAGEDKATFEEFKEEENNETERAIRKIGSKADFTINNDGEEIDRSKKVDEIMKKIIK